MKWGGCFFVKKWTFPPQSETKLMLDLFFILHFTYLGGAYAPNAPPPMPTGLLTFTRAEIGAERAEKRVSGSGERSVRSRSGERELQK